MPDIGDERYQIEWCSEIPVDPESGDAIHDAAKYVRESFPTRDEAAKRAATLIRERKDQFGAIPICRQELSIDTDTLRWERRSVRKWFDVDQWMMEGEHAEADLSHTGLPC